MTDEEIIKLIRSGGKAMEAAVKSLYASTGQSMLRFFVYHGASAEDARDLLQETFVKIASSAHTYRGEGAAAAWMWQVARNCLADFFRGASRPEHAVNDDEWGTISETVADTKLPADAVRSVDDCVLRGLMNFGRRDPERVYALTMQMDGHDIETISHHIGRRATATKQYLCECRKKLAPYIQHCTELLGP